MADGTAEISVPVHETPVIQVEDQAVSIPDTSEPLNPENPEVQADDAPITPGTGHLSSSETVILPAPHTDTVMDIDRQETRKPEAQPLPKVDEDYFDFQPPPQTQNVGTEPPTATSSDNHVPPASSQFIAAPTSNPTARPVSVPEFGVYSLLQHPATSESSAHAAQSPASIALRHHPLPPTRMGRMHTSHSPHWSQSSIRHSPPKEVVASHNGARTVDNTPLQSPGVYSPAVTSPASSSRKHHEHEEARPPSQILHSSHTAAPIETHKLNKDIDPVSGRKTVNQYELVEKLGSGTHGTVKRGKNTLTQEQVAVKIVRRSKKARLGKPSDPSEMIKKEVAILKKARHPHVVSLYEVIDDPEYDKVYLVLEYVERGEIVWRKPTDKSIGLFEKDRILREKSQGYLEDVEVQAVIEFNQGVNARRKEQEDRLEAQKALARERLASGHQTFSTSSLDTFWHRGRDSSFERAFLPSHELGVHEPVRMSRADVHAAENAGEEPQSTTAIHPSNALSQTANTEVFSASQASSRCASPPYSLPASQPPSLPPSRQVSRPQSPLGGMMSRSHIEDRSQSDLDFQQVLREIIDEQTESWSGEEEAYQHVPCLTLAQTQDVMRDTLLGIEYLHYQGIYHRDIKPANLLWTSDYRVKISDFGVSYVGPPEPDEDRPEGFSDPEHIKHDEDVELAKTVGTPAFYAPELCDPDNFEPSKKAHRPPITGQIDVWALGVTLYCMVFGRLPFFEQNEFEMYKRIGHDEAFIPYVRLKGVSHTDKPTGKVPSDHSKRPDDVLEYEAVDDTLRDLLKRLLIKDPAQRITLKEVKHHPWIIGGIENKDAWLDETDPSRHSEGKKIEVSTQDVQEAVQPLGIMQTIGNTVKRIGSVFRGRSSRKRTNSNPKALEISSLAAAGKHQEGRRSSLRGDEQIYAALRQSRDTGDHPLSNSLTASPETRPPRLFTIDSQEERPHSALEASHLERPSISTRSMSTADSMKTITARETVPRQSIVEPQSAHSEIIGDTTHSVEPNTSASSLVSGIFSGAGRRLAKSFRSRERGSLTHSPSQSSRSSSVEAIAQPRFNEDYHASPSLGFSSAIAAGHVDLPPALREEAEEYHLPTQSSAESFQVPRPPIESVRQTGGHRRSVSYAPGVRYGPSDDDLPYHRQRPASAADSNIAVSSSSDQIVSEDSAMHSRIPSVVSGASSVSVFVDEAEPKPFLKLVAVEKAMATPAAAIKPTNSELEETISADPAIAKAKAEQEQEAGYVGGEEQEGSDSEDEGLSMA